MNTTSPVHILTYLQSTRSRFQTQPARLYVPSLNRNVCAWRSTRLKLIRAGIQILEQPDDLLIQRIAPRMANSRYRDGFFIITRSQLEAIPKFAQAMQTPSFKTKGEYHWPQPPEEMLSYFFPISGR